MSEVKTEANRYFDIEDPSAETPVKRLKYFVNGEFKLSTTEKYMDCYNPSTGEIIAHAPQCTQAEVDSAIQAAKNAFPAWSATPVSKRVQVLYKMKALVDQHLEELTYLLCQEEGKNWTESMGDVLKVNEVVEFACGAPHLMKGESLMDASVGYDTVLYHHSIGVFAGIAPWNFPAMIPHGWMTPICLATGNCMVLKAASFVPQSAMRLCELWREAGLPDGVLNLVTAGRNEAEIFLKHPDVKGVSFVGSTAVGKHIYATAAAHGKRVQALTEAKNHALVLRDAKLERTARGIINAYCGCAGARCMACPVIVVENCVADELIGYLKKFVAEMTLGPAYDPKTGMGPILNPGHLKFITDWIEKGIQEGAELIVDGRNPKVPGFENGFYLGPSIFDHVRSEMTCGNEEVFGPVLFVKRVKDFEEGLAIMNASRFANGSVIYTQNGHYAREFANRTHAGMVGINVGIPVPLGIFGFTGHKDSFFGDLHMMGRDGFAFFTESRCVTQTWFPETDFTSCKVDTWDGTISSMPDKHK